MSFKYILFDMDGVIVDSMSCHVEAWKRALLEFGMEVEDDDLFHLGGVSFIDTIKILSKKYNKKFCEEDFKNIHDLKIQFFEDNYHANLFENIKNNLNLLKKKGIKMCIVSGAVRDVVNRVINENNLLDFFDFTISDDDVNRGKPNPEPYLKAVKKFGASLDECVVVEDSPSGIKAANDAKIKVCGITTTLPKEELCDADLIFENHKDLFDYLLNL